ncbi:MAG: TonB-dependent receptor [Chromatiaceae bacterium]|nr:MAG: TonB-dependent receptor [Chromatiaceae bacterium]
MVRAQGPEGPARAPAAADAALLDLPEVIVTATRTAETLDQTLAPVTVITRTDIERQQARTTLDLLRGQPGISIASTGGRGTNTSLFLRGTNANQTLFLVDGIKVGSATTGTTPFQNLPVSQLDRVEVVRGPRSSLYGSEAMGGVVQFFSRRGGGPLTPYLDVTAGGYDSAGISGGISGGGERGRFHIGGNLDDTKGFDACRGRGAPFFDGCGTDEPDRDGYRNAGVSLSAGYDLAQWASADLIFLRSESEVEFDGAFQNESEQVLQVLGATLRLQPLTPWGVLLRAGRSWDEQDNLKDGAFSSRFETRRDSLTLQNDIATGDLGLLTIGVDYQRDRVGGTTDYAARSRDNTGVFGEYQAWFGPASLKASLRRDEDEQFGGHTTGGLGLGWEFAPALRVIATYGTAFKAPTFNDLYFPSTPFFAGGNPDLQPEQSRSLELGLSGRLEIADGTAGDGRLDWSLNLFQTEIDDLIQLVPPTFAAENLDRARIRGAEAVLGGRLLGTDLGVSLTLLDPRDRSGGANDGNLLPRRPEQSLRLDLDRQFGRFEAGTTLFTAGRSFNDPANRVRLDGYTLLDLRAAYRLSETVRIQARVENLFDEDYETVAWYNQPGRTLFVTLSYRP